MPGQGEVKMRATVESVQDSMSWGGNFSRRMGIFK